MGWEAVTALSTAAIALMLLAFTIFAIILMRGVGRSVNRLENLLESVESKTGPTLDSAREATEEARGLIVKLRREADDVIDTSRRLRGKVEGAAESIEDRLIDLDALVDIAQTEIEETVLDVTAALRTGRRSKNILKRISRSISKRRR